MIIKQIRNHVLANLDAYLYQLSEKVMQNGEANVFCRNREDATNYIIRQVALAKRRKLLNQSVVTEEIGMNHVLEAEGIKGR